MARGLGDNGVLEFDSNTVGVVREVAFAEEGERVDQTAMGDANKIYSAGKAEVSGTVTCWFDSADVGQQAVVQGAAGTLVYQPEGVGSGLPQRTGPVEILNVNERFPDGEGMEFNFDVVVTGTWDKSNQA